MKQISRECLERAIGGGGCGTAPSPTPTPTPTPTTPQFPQLVSFSARPSYGSIAGLRTVGFGGPRPSYYQRGQGGYGSYGGFASSYAGFGGFGGFGGYRY